MQDISIFYSAVVEGIDITRIIVEANLSPDEPYTLSIVGMDSRTATNSRRRIISALFHNNINLNENNYVINLSPSIAVKHATNFDLPIAIALMAHNKTLPEDVLEFLKESIIVGELSLNGDIRGIRGSLAIALSLPKTRKKRLIVSLDNLAECSLISDIPVFGVSHIKQFLNLEEIKNQPVITHESLEKNSELDMSQIYGQKEAKRALEIAAAGRHHILFYGQPGSGKTMLAQRLNTILPPMERKEIVEATIIHSIAGTLKEKTIIDQRPFRSPHFSIPTASLIGGGNNLFPGEVSLAHAGTLFLDEILEHKSIKLENLRQILEEHEVRLKRQNNSVVFPASFMLVGALNACPCGYYGSPNKKCRCSYYQIRTYLGGLSGPLLDRIDMQVGINALDINTLENNHEIIETSAEIRSRVERAYQAQVERNHKGITNGMLEGHRIEKYSRMTSEAKKYLHMVYEKLQFSMRSYHKIIKVSRTIADLEGFEKVEIPHIKEALMYRSFEKFRERFNEASFGPSEKSKGI